MSKHLSAKYYQENKERPKKSLRKMTIWSWKLQKPPRR